LVSEAPPAFTWELVNSGDDSPGLRSRHCLAYDSNAGATVLFGGIVWVGGGRLLSDTWELRDGYWAPVVSSRQPQSRHRGAMAYDSERGYSVLFGGQGVFNQMLGDTWIYQDRRWTRLRQWSWRRPSPRCGHALAFDEEAGEIILFGGITPWDRPLRDTWRFDGSCWRPVRGPSPPARRYAALAYDPHLRGCLLHGGAVDDRGRENFGDAWLFRDGAWTELPDPFWTDSRDDHGLAYHRAAQRLIMLEGVAGARGVLGLQRDGWCPVEVSPLHPRHQCSPLVWDDGLDGLVLHGGEARHGGPQFGTTLVLRLAMPN
jgi:hypothetical protein